MMNVNTDVKLQWIQLEAKLTERFGKKPDMEAMLFLIGMQETGFIQQKITKEQKQDLMHVAVCTLLQQDGFYEKEGIDKDGWPHFRQVKSIPPQTLAEQEDFLKKYILQYFKQQDF